MTEEEQEQYNILQISIRGNINAIRILIMQVDRLNATIASLDDKDAKAALDESIKAVYQSINVLIDETDKLFTSLQKLKESAKRA
jgi:hypothetical protein